MRQKRSDIKLSLKWDDLGASTKIRAAVARGKDPDLLYRQVGAWMIKSVEKTFRARGRPSRWQLLSRATIDIRRRLGKKPGAERYLVKGDVSRKILEVGGDLRHDWDTRTRNKTLEIGSGKFYSRFHQPKNLRATPIKVFGRVPAKIPVRIMIQWLREDLKRAALYSDRWAAKVKPQ